MALGVVWVLGCCAYLVHLLLSLTGCLASPVSTSWTPSLTTCCPERGGVCWDAGQRKVGVCWWSPLIFKDYPLDHYLLLFPSPVLVFLVVVSQETRPVTSSTYSVYNAFILKQQKNVVCRDLFKSILPIDPSFSVLSLSRSYTTRSEVKQAALQRVCSSLTPCLQTNSGQFEERGEKKGGERVRSYTEGLRLWRQIALLRSRLYSHRAVRWPLSGWRLAGRMKLWLHC